MVVIMEGVVTNIIQTGVQACKSSQVVPAFAQICDACSRMSLILTLSKYILHPICTEWLEVADRRLLLRALCRKELGIVLGGLNFQDYVLQNRLSPIDAFQLWRSAVSHGFTVNRRQSVGLNVDVTSPWNEVATGRQYREYIKIARQFQIVSIGTAMFWSNALVSFVEDLFRSQCLQSLTLNLSEFCDFNKFDVPRMDKLVDLKLEFFRGCHLLPIVVHCRSVRRLSLTAQCYMGSSKYLDMICLHSPALLELSVECEDFLSKHLRSLVWASPELSKLSILSTGKDSVDLRLLESAATKLDTLALKDCYQFTDVQIQGMISQLPALTSLSLRNCYWQQPSLTLADCLQALPATLTSLDVVNYFFRKVDDRRVNMLNCKKLTSVTLSSCGLVDSDLMLLFWSQNNRTTLTHLDVSQSRLSPRAFMDIASHGPNLKHLNIRHSLNASDAELGHVAALCDALESLDVSHCSLTSKGIIALLEAKPGLARLEMSSLPFCNSKQVLDYVRDNGLSVEVVI